MQWSETCNAYPNQWLIIKALKPHTASDYRRRLDETYQRYGDQNPPVRRRRLCAGGGGGVKRKNDLC
jgi:hypothetical protein